MVSGTVDCEPFTCPGVRARGRRQATGREGGRALRVRARRHGALRARHVAEHDGHLRVARQARSAVAPARPRTRTAGAAADPARGEASHRRVGRRGQVHGRRRPRRRTRRRRQRHRSRRATSPGSALAQFLAMRANGTDFAGVADEAPPTPRPSRRRPAPAARRACPGAPRPRRGRPTPAWQTDVPSVEALPIPDYDELSASQVVERLEGLDRDSLEADPPLRERAPRPQHHPRQDRAAQLTWRRAGRRRPTTSRASWSSPSSCAPSSAAMRGGALWLERDAWPEPLDDAYDALLDARRRARSSSAPSTTSSSGFGAVVVETLRSGARLGVITDLFVEDRGARGRASARRWSTTLVALLRASAGASASTPSRCPGHRAAKNFFEAPALHRARRSPCTGVSAP